MKGSTTSKKFTKDELTLIRQCMNTAVYFERESVLQFARQHYFVDTGRNTLKLFSGNWNDLLKYDPSDGKYTVGELLRKCNALCKKLGIEEIK